MGTESVAGGARPPGAKAAPPPGGVVLRVHRIRGEVVVAACDSELLGTDVMLGSTKVPVSSHFYGEVAVSEEEFLLHVRRGSIVNLLGPRVVEWAQRAGLLSTQGTGRLGGIPHAQIVQIR